MKEESSLLLLAHGSKDPRWCAPFIKLEKSLKQSLGEDGIFLCYMEFAEPTLMDAAKAAVNAGAKKIKVLPLFMAGGAHLDKDVPPLIAEVQQAYPDLIIEAMGPIGEQPPFIDLICQIATEAV